MASTIAEEKAARMSLTALYTIIPVSFTALGMQVFMCWFGLIVFFETPKPAREGRRMYMICSWLILILFSLSQIADGVEMFNLLANSTSSLEALTKLRPVYEFTWWRITSSMGLWICNWIGDGLLLYRCYMMWYDQRWICVIPGLAYLGSLVVSTMAMAYRVKWMINPSLGPLLYSKTLQAWIFLSISVNCVVTALISYRLLKVRKQLSEVLSPQDLDIYLGIISILVESALPLSLAGIAFAALSTPSNSGPLTVARTVALLCWFSLNALCPQIIIFRVTTGRSWISQPSATGPPSSHRQMSTNIEFTDPSCTDSKLDPEVSFTSTERERRPHPSSFRLNRVSEENQSNSDKTVVDVVRRRSSRDNDA